MTPAEEHALIVKAKVAGWCLAAGLSLLLWVGVWLAIRWIWFEGEY